MSDHENKNVGAWQEGPTRMHWRHVSAAVLLSAAAVSSTGVAVEPLAGWRYTRAIQLDTTAAGANVPADVKQYPLAIALDASTFDFSQAQSSGADVRFTGRAGVLPHSIEQWDPKARTALVWVKVDVVPGNRRSDALSMHWGNPKAPDVSASAAVFDTTEGFVGVWHLDEEGSTVRDGYKDATVNAAHGTGVNLVPGSRAPARLGYGVGLDHARNQWITIASEKRKLFDLTKRVTFSIWARARSYANKGDETQGRRMLPGYETMFAKGDSSWRLQKFGIRNWHKPPADLIEVCIEKIPKEDLCVVGTTDMVTDRWFHFAGVHDYPQVKLYVNGVLDKTETFNVEWTSEDHPVGIGNQSQFPDRGRAWDGVLDEARVLSVVKDEHWIKLDYESQREGQRLVRFGPVVGR